MMKFLRHVFFDDFMLKLFSFVLAVLFWLTVSFAIQQNEVPSSVSGLSLTSDMRMIVHLPLAPMSPSEARKIKLVPSEVDVTVQGDARLIQNLQSRDVRAVVDLAGVDRSSTNRVLVTIPAGLTFVRVVPAEVQVVVPPRS